MKKFDFVIGNPPYQDERQGDSNTALPIYHKFMDAAFEVGNAVEMITPARYLFNAGRTPKDWNKKMLNDIHFKVQYYVKDGKIVFPTTDIKGGVAITYRDKSRIYEPIQVFTVYPELNGILDKIVPNLSNGSLSTMAFVATKFNTDNLFKDFPKYRGHERRMSSNVLSFDCFHSSKKSNRIEVFGVINNKRTSRFIDEKYVDISDESIQKYKVIIPKADGEGNFGDIITNPVILKPKTGFTHTFLGIGGVDTEYEANSIVKYMKTQFTRCLLSIYKVTQDMNDEKWALVPLQDFSRSSDIDWSQSVVEIDQQLYKKYDFSNEEIEFIETHVQEMK